MTETSVAFLEKNKSENATLLDLGFCTMWIELGQDFLQRKIVLFVYPKEIKKIKFFDVYAQKNGYSDALEHFQQEFDLSAIFTH